MDVGVAAKAFTICQSEKVLILSIKSEIFWLHCFLLGYLNRKRANQRHI